MVIAQQTVIRGKVIDAETGDPIPFANVVIQGTSIGTPTDFDGYYEIIGEAASDTLIVSYIGYERKKKIYQKGVTQVINFQLNPEATSLGVFVVTAGEAENPAFPIMREVIRNKNKNDKRRLPAYEYESYNKIEIDVDNITDKFKQKKFVQKITQVLDSIEVIAGEDGKPILPLFISESLSTFYFRSNPRLQKELIRKTKITGVGIEDGSLVSQIIGSSFQEYNFYQNRLNIVEKEFASPIADGWRLLYNYELIDSTYIDEDYCYILEFKPTSDQDLAFVGTMWITKEEYAIKRIDVTVQKTANLNFIEKIKIQQELFKSTEGAWIPMKSRVLIDVSELSKKSAGFLAKFYTSNKDIRVAEPKGLRFYERTIELEEEAHGESDEFWEANRHDPLSPTEISVMQMIDTLNNIPLIKTWTEIFKTVARGYVEVGQLDLGPWPLIFSVNEVEGARFRVGGRTNENFSRNWQFKGYLAYGLKDERYKYGMGAKWIASRKNWTTFSLQYQKDIDQLGLQLDETAKLDDGSAFIALNSIGNLARPFRYEQTQFDFKRQLTKAWSVGLRFKNRDFHPLFDYRYFADPENTDSLLGTDFTTSEATVFLKFARDEAFLINDNNRISLGTNRWPSVTLAYTRGIKGVFKGDFDYHRLNLSITQRLKMGLWGVSRYRFNAVHNFSTVPYPLLQGHIGNEQFIYTKIAYNQMNLYEFVSDTYASLQFRHSFEGFFLNRVPLIKKLKWRLVGTANVLFGGMRDANKNAQPVLDETGSVLPSFNTLQPEKPYVELGYGVENIFKFFRVDVIHRLTYLNQPSVDKTGIKFSFSLSL